MGKIKELVTSVVEMYDFRGLSIREIAINMGMSQEEVTEILANWSMSYSPDDLDFDDSMDGDEASALASAGFGTDEDYGYFGDNE
jgi:hypothetical protein